MNDLEPNLKEQSADFTHGDQFVCHEKYDTTLSLTKYIFVLLICNSIHVLRKMSFCLYSWGVTYSYMFRKVECENLSKSVFHNINSQRLKQNESLCVYPEKAQSWLERTIFPWP